MSNVGFELFDGFRRGSIGTRKNGNRLMRYLLGAMARFYYNNNYAGTIVFAAEATEEAVRLRCRQGAVMSSN